MPGPSNFFALQPEDNFTVIYDQKYVDSTNVGLGAIWGARFEHGGKTYYAIPFLQDGKLGYWDENGNSLRKALPKAPLKFSRISFRVFRIHVCIRCCASGARTTGSIMPLRRGLRCTRSAMAL